MAYQRARVCEAGQLHTVHSGEEMQRLAQDRRQNRKTYAEPDRYSPTISKENSEITPIESSIMVVRERVRMSLISVSMIISTGLLPYRSHAVNYL